MVAGDATQPTLSPPAAAIQSNGSLTSSTLGNTAADGFSVNSAVGPITFTPIADGAGNSEATIVNGTAAVYPNVWPSTDVVVRPDALGASQWLSIASSAAPMSYSFDVGISSDQNLTQLADGAIAITDGADVYSPPDLTDAIAQDPVLGLGWSTTDPGDLPDPADDVDPTGSQDDGGNAGAETTPTTTDSTQTTSTANSGTVVTSVTTAASTTTSDSQTSVTTAESAQTPTGTVSASSDATSSAATETTPTTTSQPAVTASDSAATPTTATTSTDTPSPTTTGNSATDTTETNTANATTGEEDSSGATGPVNEVSIPSTGTPAGDPQPQQTTLTGAAEAAEIANADAATNGSAVEVIMPPAAVDANGQPVPVSMTIDPTTDTLTLQVSPGPNTAYPVLVDPSVVAPNDAAAAAQHKVSYGLSSEWPISGPDDALRDPTNNQPINDGSWQDDPYNQDPYSTTPHLDPYLTQALHPKFTRVTLPYNCPDQVVQTWLAAVQPTGLTPIITFEAPFPADARNPDPHPSNYLCTVADPSTQDHPDRAQYLAGVQSIIQYAHQQFGVKYFAAWNEPDIHTRDPATHAWVAGGNAVSPQRAAKYWDWASQAARSAGCAGCTIIAGEFSGAPVGDYYLPDGTYNHKHGTTTFLNLYTKTLAAMHDADPAHYRLPHVWSLHDYADELNGVRGGSPDAQIKAFEDAVNSANFNGLTVANASCFCPMRATRASIALVLAMIGTERPNPGLQGFGQPQRSVADCATPPWSQ